MCIRDREQTLLEKRLAICMTCGRVGSWKNRPTFEDLAVMFEGSTASGAERAYRKAMDLSLIHILLWYSQAIDRTIL